MSGSVRAESVDDASCSFTLFDRIGGFLRDHRLGTDPASYALVHAILSDPAGSLGRAAARITEGGVRLTTRDIDRLCDEGGIAAPQPDRANADGLVAQTQLQVEGFADMVQGLRDQANGFGRDLAASADRIRRQQDALPTQSDVVDEVARITATMVSRVRVAEAQLETATREADELRAKLEEARDNARRDPLTDLPNRRVFEESFAACLAAGKSMCLAVCDIDHFKRVNDRFGHAVGDRVLKAIATALSETCAPHLVARYGGEEFVVIFTDIDTDSARAAIDAARGVVAHKRYRLRETDQPLGSVTISAGLVRVEEGDNARSAFGRADALLYAAKNEGRNCVRAA
ncbi:GGDEF domain-containing protein [Sphingomonas sp.]|uniref:GGDEF domain-containing protein n=1 Tax=Sphingomonas sp. TaxID=28214 RepID=UPI002CF3512B|nr:GGDEF domain-containing protein [Sphingomonas sp.]HWK35822.1 GGDEF domain-containing protein [Sphingomonas sp.]